MKKQIDIIKKNQPIPSHAAPPVTEERILDEPIPTPTAATPVAPRHSSALAWGLSIISIVIILLLAGALYFYTLP